MTPIEKLLTEGITRANLLKIAVIGDCMVDEYHQVQVNRISPEFPIPVMLSPDDKPHHVAPGGAANVAYQLRNFTADVKLCGLMDQKAANAYKARGLNVGGSIIDDWLQVPRKKRLYHGDFPICRWDIESRDYGVPEEQFEYTLEAFADGAGNVFRDSDVVIFSDYNKGIFKKPWPFSLLLGCNCKTIVDPKSSDITKWSGCTVFKPNAVEARALSGMSDPESQCKYFRGKLGCQAVVITQGGDGVIAYNDGKMFNYKPKHVPTCAASVIGAGDCFVAILALCLGHDMCIEEAIEVAFEAGSLYVQNRHNQPISPYELRQRADPITAKIVNAWQIQDKDCKYVFTNGCFDILHAGHVATLQFAKSKGDRLIVGVNSDESVRRLKGPNRPVNKLADRMKALAAVEVVDYVVSFEDDTPLEVIKLMRPDVIVKGGDYSKDNIVGASLVKEVYTAPLLPGLSTTDIISKIKSSEG
jgi:D-beta-D-heptose 7-phosphate kinase/D-beta-D-heptose 1-phosphate adenosyltransferase